MMYYHEKIVQLTQTLDSLVKKENDSISSYDNLKVEALRSLEHEVQNISWLTKFKTQDCIIIPGFLMDILCKMANEDKNLSIRLLALRILYHLINSLNSAHNDDHSRCSRTPLKFVLPGVSSKLIKLLMKDTKSNSSFMNYGLMSLTELITSSFAKCNHQQYSYNEILNICDNLGIRLSFLIDYMIINSGSFTEDIHLKVLKLCQAVVYDTEQLMIDKTSKSMIKFIALESTSKRSSEGFDHSITPRINHIIQKYNAHDIISIMLEVLKELSGYYDKSLSGERYAQISILCGLTNLITDINLTIIFENNDKRCLFLNTLVNLTEFAIDQPILYLCNVPFDDLALENINKKLYTSEKHFKHINGKELELIAEISSNIGQKLNWMCLVDIIRNNLRQFFVTSNLFITHLILKGCLKRENEDLRWQRISQLTLTNIEFYLNKIQEGYLILNEDSINGFDLDQSGIVKVVVAIETIVTLTEIHVNNTQSKTEKVVILKSSLCHLLNWASSSISAISEASLVALNQLSILYETDSTKSLIEANIDYVVEGVMRMLDSFAYNSEITNVLAITFKLSSPDTFYYFRDVYEKIFKLLGIYHSTNRSKYIALLFYRTVSILNDWKTAREDTNELPCDKSLLQNVQGIDTILNDIDVKRRLRKLELDFSIAEELRCNLDNRKVTKEDEDQVINDIRTGKVVEDENKKVLKEDIESSEKTKPVEIELTEKILYHCVSLSSSNYDETKILALKTASRGFDILCDCEDTMLPLVHQMWSPLLKRLTKDYSSNLELKLSSFECLLSMAIRSKDFIKGRALDSIIPSICLFLSSQAKLSYGKKDFESYCFTVGYKSQLEVLTNLGALAYHIEVAYKSLWQIIKITLLYLDQNQPSSLRRAAKISLNYLVALDADCTWYFAKESNQLSELPLELIYENTP